jgi:perosamine synthetase
MLHRAKPYVDVSRIIEELHSSDLASGHHISSFEEKLRRKIGASYCAALSQGRAALLLALRILDIGKGDEVIAPSFICRVVIDAIGEVGARPVLADSSAEDFNISPGEVMKRISRSTKAIVAPHIHGVPCDIEEISRIAKQNKCFLIEDCAHTMNAKYRGKNVGTFGDLAFFSMNFDKPFSTGEGGAIVVNNEQLITKTSAVLARYQEPGLEDEKNIVYGLLVEHLLTERDAYIQTLGIGFGGMLIRGDRRLFRLVDNLILTNASEEEFRNRVHRYLGGFRSRARQIVRNTKKRSSRLMRHAGQLPRDEHNERIEKKAILMGPMRAIVGTIGLDSLDNVDSHRNEIASLFERKLARLSGYSRPTLSPEKEPIFLRYNVLNATKFPVSEISRQARERGVEIGNFNWSDPVHRIPPYNELCGKRAELKTSEMISEHIINLPVHYYVDRTDVELVVSILERFDRKLE